MAKGKKKSKKDKSGKKEPLVLPRLILPKIPPPPSPTAQTQTLLFTVSTGDSTSLSRMVGHYGYENSLKTTDLNGSNSLHIAVRKGDVEMVKRLLSFPQTRSLIDATEDPKVGGLSCLHVACKDNNRELVEILINSFANLNLKSTCGLGETPLHICCKLGHQDCAKLLIDAGANADARDSFGHNPSYWASCKQFGTMIKDLSLPPIHRASPKEHFALLIAKNPKPKEGAEIAKKSKKSGKSGKDGEKKKKKKK